MDNGTRCGRLPFIRSPTYRPYARVQVSISDHVAQAAPLPGRAAVRTTNWKHSRVAAHASESRMVASAAGTSRHGIASRCFGLGCCRRLAGIRSIGLSSRYSLSTAYSKHLLQENAYPLGRLWLFMG